MPCSRPHRVRVPEIRTAPGHNQPAAQRTGNSAAPGEREIRNNLQIRRRGIPIFNSPFV